jgi:hypothetical protein
MRRWAVVRLTPAFWAATSKVAPQAKVASSAASAAAYAAYAAYAAVTHAARRIFIGRNVLVEEGSFLLPFVPSKDSYHGRRWRQLLGLKPVGQCNLGSVEPAAKVRTEAATVSSKAVGG